jgi:N1-aminopropylagmatine ureohydrolase
VITQFSDSPQRDPCKARVHLLPVPLEQSVSYGGGTAKGPGAILEASYQLENYDREFDKEPGPEYGIYTYPFLDLPKGRHLEAIADRVEEIYHPDRLLGVLGGEHSLTEPVVEGLLRKIDGPLTVVQLDAHCDLRDSYEENSHSHACVSRRLLEQDRVEQVLQFGIRSLCLEEAKVLQEEPRVSAWYTEQVQANEHLEPLARLIRGKTVYLTVDVDCFDPALVPSTGTPEPNGLTYLQAEEIVRIITKESRLIAFDCVELAPISGFHASDFLVAKFLYRLMNLRLASP